MADFGQTDFGQPFWATEFGQTDFGQRLCFSGMADFGQNRVWPKPTLAKTDFGQTEFDLWCCVLCVVCCVLCVCVWCVVCLCVCVLCVVCCCCVLLFVCCLCVGVVCWFHGTALPGTALPGTALPTTAQNFALFSPLPPQCSFFSSLSWVVLSWNFGGVFEAPEHSNVHVWALGLLCETPAALGPFPLGPHPSGPPTPIESIQPSRSAEKNAATTEQYPHTGTWAERHKRNNTVACPQAHFRVPALQKKHQNSTRRPPERERTRPKMGAGEGKKSAKFWPPAFGPPPFGPPLFGPPPFGPPPYFFWVGPPPFWPPPFWPPPFEPPSFEPTTGPWGPTLPPTHDNSTHTKET